MRNLAIYIALFITGFTQAQNDELRKYQELGIQNNPEISSLSKQVQISGERVNEAASLPDTEFNFGYFVSEPETRTGAQELKVSFRQSMPWFGTIQARKDYAGSLVNLDQINLAIAKRKLKLNISQRYFNLYELKEKQEALQENIELLDVYQTMALNSVEVGKASAVEVLRLKMRQNDLMEQYKKLQLELEAGKNELQKLLNVEGMPPVQIEDTLLVPVRKKEEHRLLLHPELERYDELAKSVENAENVNRQESAPKFGFGLDYISVKGREGIRQPDNGKDILMPMLSFSVPIFNKKYRSVSIQNELKQEQISTDRLSVQNELESRLRTALNERAAARIKLETQLDNLGQARNAEKLLLKQYETGTIDFDDVLDIQEIQLQIQISLIEAVSTWFKKDAQVAYLTVNTL